MLELRGADAASVIANRMWERACPRLARRNTIDWIAVGNSRASPLPQSQTRDVLLRNRQFFFRQMQCVQHSNSAVGIIRGVEQLA